jgi:predicted oxidoreductase
MSMNQQLVTLNLKAQEIARIVAGFGWRVVESSITETQARVVIVYELEKPAQATAGTG